MLLNFIFDLSTWASVLLIISLLSVFFFEAINGFHDTANAVATVIYTKTLKPKIAVVWSGFMNFVGVFFGGIVMAWILGLFGSSADSSGIGVAMGIVKLMPVNEMLASGLTETVSLVLAVLFAAIVWNLGTWYYGIPCSSSHTLIGSLLGAGFAFSVSHPKSTVNWQKAQEIGMSLLISPLFGFFLAVMLMYMMRVFIKNKKIFKEPDTKKAPPFWIRVVLLLTCTLVSFFHGSNDGQKGVGLLLVVMMAFMPLQFAFNPDVDNAKLKNAATEMQASLTRAAENDSTHAVVLRAHATNAGKIAARLDTLDRTNKEALIAARKDIQNLNKGVKNSLKDGDITDKSIRSAVKSNSATLAEAYEFAPLWGVVMISLCLGIGTMIGWKRIVVTIGEKIGKSHLTYAQGASAELCAAATIGVSTGLGLPVSTTHVLSSGIAGTMVAEGGVKNLQKKTIRNIALAWLLTLPVTFAAGFLLFFVFRMFV
jgi:inorganic phosphate transporter, PiT family